MKLEQKINTLLMEHPKLKKIIKRLYQRFKVILTRPKKVEGNVKCVSPQDEYDYFFGYYDKSPWDANNRYILCMKAKDTSKEVAPQEVLDILLIDTKNDFKAEKIAESHAWNVQQGCMAQWLGPNYDKEIIYNDFRGNKYQAIIFNVETKEEKQIDFPIYSVSSDGNFALSLDFARLHRLRPGYGYSNIEDVTYNEKIPNSPCVWLIDLKNNKTKPYLTYEDFYNFEQREEMKNAEHKVNHIMISPNNDRFMVIHRWLKGSKKYSRLIVCDIKCKKLYNLSDDNMVSHCYWKNNNEIIGFLNKKNEGNGYYLIDCSTHKYTKINKYLTSDGHPSYNNDQSLILTDTYPNGSRISTLRILNGNVSTILAKVYSPFQYDNDTRCDLHPRWSRDNNTICFDGCFESKRRLYTINVAKLSFPAMKEINVNINQKAKYKVLFILNTCRKCGPTQVVFNIIKKLDLSKFEPILLTIEEERADTNLKEIYPYVKKHYFISISKKDILNNRLKRLEEIIDTINPNVIHSTGAFPDYAVAKLKKYPQIVTLHNYVYDDYISKFGKIKGLLLAKMQLYAAKNATKTVACSKSLTSIYKSKLGLDFDYIQNGINLEKFKKTNKKNTIRNELGISNNAFIYIYTGQFIVRKNIGILLEAFNEVFSINKDTYFMLLGEGPELNILKEKYSKNSNIIFTGNVTNVENYLEISNVYVSASRSEGLPNGVLEAMACKLPVLLSNIPQHVEIVESTNKKVGYTFPYDNIEKVKKVMQLIRTSKEYEEYAQNARKVIEMFFSDIVMSQKYQDEYLKIAHKGEKNER